jgi:hypothetical protein
MRKLVLVFYKSEGKIRKKTHNEIQSDCFMNFLIT